MSFFAFHKIQLSLQFFRFLFALRCGGNRGRYLSRQLLCRQTIFRQYFKVRMEKSLQCRTTLTILTIKMALKDSFTLPIYACIYLIFE